MLIDPVKQLIHGFYSADSPVVILIETIDSIAFGACSLLERDPIVASLTLIQELIMLQVKVLPQRQKRGFEVEGGCGWLFGNALGVSFLRGGGDRFHFLIFLFLIL
jgi:hypothetical protein